MKLKPHTILLLLTPFLCTSLAYAIDCSNLPTQFTGNEFPSGDFFSNFQNSCYAIPLPMPGASGTDLHDTAWQIFYKVDPRYQLIVTGSFPNARFFSVTAYDDHYLVSQAILDANIVPLTSSYVNPFQPGVPFAAGQPYAVPVNFGGTPGTLETGCQMNGYNVDINALDATQRHQGINWNTDPGFFVQTPAAPLHIVDTPQHSNPPATGYLLVRAYLDINSSDPLTNPSLIVRDVASGCAYPAAYALETLQIVSTTAAANTWLNQNQFQAHQAYDANYLPSFCYATDPQNSVSWSRDGEFVSLPNPYGTYIKATLPANLPATLASAGEVMRLRLRLPVTPPTPCTTGCARSGNEQMRYTGLSFYGTGPTLASVADSDFTQDAHGYATLIVGTGAKIPAWVTPANGYTFLDLTSVSGYKKLQTIQMRNILAAANFACSAQNVPYKTTVFTPQGGLMGDYLPVVDYPLASSLPQVAAELIGPNACGVLPAGLPATAPNCGVLSSNPIVITSVPAPAPGETPIAVQSLPPITISGQGFGLLPLGLPFTGNSGYLQVADITQNWSAGYTGSACNVSVGDWADNRIELVANVNSNGLCPMAMGDQLAISVWNPQTMAPSTANITVAPVVTYALGTNSTLVGGAAGNGTVELLTTGPWTATGFATWLHVSSETASGVGSALIQFSYDANPNPGVQTGTLNIAGLTFTVTQAGAGYVPVTSLANLVASGLNGPQGVAVDNQGNLYIADTGNNVIEQWNAVTKQVAALVSSGLSGPTGVAVDAGGNVYIADTGNHAIEQWNVSRQQLNLIVPGLNAPSGVAVDAQGNVYFSDSAGNVIEEWNAASQQVTTLGGSNLSGPTGVAVDAFGNVYFANTGNNSIGEWNAGNQQVTTPVSSGISGPSGVAVDGQGNVYFADGGNNAIKQWNAASQQVVTLVSSGLSHPAGVALDLQGNLYVADQNSNTIKEFTFGYLSLSVTSLNEGAQAGVDSVSAQILPVNATLAAVSDQPWLTVTSVTGGTIGFAFQPNTSVASRTAHILVLGQQVTVTQSGDTPANIAKSSGDGQSTPVGQAFPIALEVNVTDAGGSPVVGAAVNFQVVAGPAGASAMFSPAPPLPLLTDQNGNAAAPLLNANGFAGQFTVTASVGALTTTFTLTNSGSSYALGSSSTVVGSTAGSGTVVLIASGAWTAASNASWLQISPESTNGIGGALVQFSYAASSNPGPQTGTLTVAGLTFTVTQAGTSYSPASLVTTVASGLNKPQGVGLDLQGNVYIADTGDNTIDEWNVGTQQLTPIITTALNGPAAVAVDRSANVYIADSGNNAIEKWNASGGQVTTFAPALANPSGVATDTQGNVYFSDTGHNLIGESNAAGLPVGTVVGAGLSSPTGVAVDVLGNVYFADTGHNMIGGWNATAMQVTILVSGLNGPTGVAVDGQGNVYFSDTGNNAVKQWNPASRQVVTLPATGLGSPTGLAVDGAGNLYVADTNNGAVRKFTFGYISLGAGSRSEGAQAGSDSVTAQVLPASLPLSATSDQPWLTITGVAGGAVGFSYQANPFLTARMAHITVLGQQVTVTQSGDIPAVIAKSAGDSQTTALGQAFGVALQVTVTDAGGVPTSGVGVTFSVVPGPAGAGATFAGTPGMPILTDQNGHATAPVLTANTTGGTFTVAASVNQLTVNFNLTNLAYALAAPSVIVGTAAGNADVWLLGAGPWSATSNASWLQLVASSGSGNTLIQFSYSANSSTASRTGTLTIAGLTFTVTQTGTSYTTVNFLQTLVSSGLKNPQGIALDSVGNVYIADTSSNTVKKWTAATKALSTPIPSGLNTPAGVSVDAKGNIYIADSKNNAIKVWNVTNQQVTSLGIGTLNLPIGIAVDSQGNVYLSDSGHNAIKEWVAATKVVTTLVSGLNGPRGVAVDPQGNVYFADTNNNQVKEWIAATKAVVTLVSGLNSPRGVALDSQNNLYIADANNNAIKQWNPTSLQVVTLPVTGLKGPGGVAVDSAANVYIGDTNDSIIREFTAGYLAFSAGIRNEGPQAGTDSVTAFALPASLPLAATSNQSWLKITGSSGGVISFSFTANTSVNSRTAQITVLGQSVTVTQGGDVPTTMTIAAGNGQSTPVSHAFATALEVRVKDAAGNGVGGVAVTFTVTPGTNGASGTFASSVPVITTAGGYATASTLTAKTIAGTFTVTATAGATSTIFHLTITLH